MAKFNNRGWGEGVNVWLLVSPRLEIPALHG